MHAARQHALEQLRIGHRIVGVRLHLDRERRCVAVRCRSWPGSPCYFARKIQGRWGAWRKWAARGHVAAAAKCNCASREDCRLSAWETPAWSRSPTSRRRAASSPARCCARPCCRRPKLSALTGAEVFVKYENLQVTNSFKERGAVNKLRRSTPAERARGVIAMSAGNHAQAVAYHAARLGIPATIVMPVTTPFVKVEATQRLWRRGGARRRDHRRGAGACRGASRRSAA